jgi:hypothetical protein
VEAEVMAAGSGGGNLQPYPEVLGLRDVPAGGEDGPGGVGE